MTSTRPLAVCSWSLRPSGPADLVEKLGATGLRRVQLALRPFVERAWSIAETKRRLAVAGVAVVSGMMEPFGEDYSTPATIRRTGGLRPDATWERNLEIARRSTAAAVAFGIDLVTFHAGFVPHQDGPERAAMIERLRTTRDVFGSARVRVALETGQESAAILAELLDDPRLAGIGVNFDPANMLLYGSGDPIDALKTLARRVVQVHAKDATPPAAKDVWGEEVPVGRGKVDWTAFFAVLAAARRDVAVVVEREAGDRRVEDVREAAAFLGRVAGVRP